MGWFRFGFGLGRGFDPRILIGYYDFDLFWGLWLILDPYLIIWLCFGAILTHLGCVWMSSWNQQSQMAKWWLVGVKPRPHGRGYGPCDHLVCLLLSFLLFWLHLLWLNLGFDIIGCRYDFSAKILIWKLVVI